MRNKEIKISIAAVILSAVHVIVSIFAVRRLPEQVPLRFNVEMICEAVGSRWAVMAVAAVILLLVLAMGLPTGSALLPRQIVRQSQQSLLRMG